MAHCASDECQRWRPGVFTRHFSGLVVDGRWFCSQACVERMAERLLIGGRVRTTGLPAVAPLRLGALLRHHGVITLPELDRAVAAQRESRLKLGEQLIVNGVDATAVLRGLAAQAGIGYIAAIDPASVREAPGSLPRDAVRALGVVPFSEPDDADRIKAACVAPVPYGALNALRQLTGWTVVPYLVADTTFASLMEQYGADAPAWSLNAGAFVRADNLHEAARRIAAAAANARRTTVTEAHWDPYSWVRVRGEDLVHDVLVAHDPQEAPCPAASTSH